MNTELEFYVWGLWVALLITALYIIPRYIRERIAKSKKMALGSEPYEPFQEPKPENDLTAIEKNDSGRLI